MLSQPAIGLDITSSSLMAVALKKRGKSYALDQVFVAPLPHGVVVDGEVQDIDQLANAITEMWRDQNIKSKTVNIALANQKCVTRLVDLPKLKNKNHVRDAIRFEVQDQLPIPIEEAVWDWHPVDEFTDPESGTLRQRFVLVMAYRDSVERFRDAVSKAGLKLKLVDSAAFALMRAASATVNDSQFAQPMDPDHATAICYIGPAKTNMVIARNGICEMSRIVPFGTQSFSQALAEQFGWSMADADRVKFEAGVQPLGGVEAPGDPYTETRQVMQYIADRCASDLRTSMEYYHAQHGHPAGRLIIAGEGALLRGIEERLSNEISVPVTILNAAPLLDAASAEKLGHNHAHLAVALGLGMEDAA